MRSVVFWGGLVPLGAAVALVNALAVGRARWALGVVGLFVAVNAAMLTRIYVRRRGEGDPGRDALLYASSCMLGKYPELQGMMLFVLNRLRRRQSRLIEY